MMAPEDKAAALRRERERQKITNAYHRVFGNKDGQTVIDDMKAQFVNLRLQFALVGKVLFLVSLPAFYLRNQIGAG